MRARDLFVPYLSCLLDVWSAPHKKQLSISWEPERPWGAWIPLLDLVPPADWSGKG
jgi:hypothetical protein